ncbi:MAG: calcium/sodium antiporter [Candidatus Diapherotrites archaeon]|uniref:Calcium/sodium antiporter n=1 Tax=Candidatus Iainarchaeum sp. TaxID=3101447 RepID=A0A7J4ITP0_9ARCH|nr:MAG: inner membrane protein [archaeon GW2011_AR10]MBS3059328.1 calcium/sodium antiporter [Candidatus Diapherotrites archaeon]HIH08200.1 calcium/sodium antiporter [Candidatus Diapherotrites archaeon]
MASLGLFIFVIGLVVLIKGADLFVEAAAKISRLLGVSPFVIGLTLVAIGTSLPELATSITASFSGNPDLIMGTIVGSNIANISFIVAITILLGGAVKVDKKIFESDAFIMFLASILLFYFSLNGVVGFFEGLFFLVAFIAYMALLFKLKPRFEQILDFQQYLKIIYGMGLFLLNLKMYREIVKHGLNPATYRGLLEGDKEDDFEGLFGKKLEKKRTKEFIEQYRSKLISRLLKQLIIFFFAVIGVWLGAKLTVDGAVDIASSLNISEEVIALTAIAVGTSLPELSVSLSSVRKGFDSIFLGNIIGSNTSNILLVLGISAIIRPIQFSLASFVLPLAIMIITTTALMVSIYGDWKISRLEATAFLILYGVFLYLTFFSAAAG